MVFHSPGAPPPCKPRLAKYGFDDGLAGHITVRDPEKPDHYWVNQFGMHFSQIKVSNLVLVNHYGDIVEGSSEGTGIVNGAAFAIHSQIHAARPDAVAAAHSHSTYGKAWSSLGRMLDPITQDACAFIKIILFMKIIMESFLITRKGNE